MHVVVGLLALRSFEGLQGILAAYLVCKFDLWVYIKAMFQCFTVLTYCTSSFELLTLNSLLV